MDIRTIGTIEPKHANNRRGDLVVTRGAVRSISPDCSSVAVAHQNDVEILSISAPGSSPADYMTWQRLLHRTLVEDRLVRLEAGEKVHDPQGIAEAYRDGLDLDLVRRSG